MLDAIAVERRGVPAVVIGSEKLVLATGRAMARAQGYADLRIATVSHPAGILESVVGDTKEVQRLAAQATPQVEKILLGQE